MNRLLIALGCTLLLLITGCFYLAERPTVARIVSLNFPTPKGQTNVSLSVKDPEVQEALKLIDAVLVSDGFVRDLNRPGANEPGLIGGYAKFDDKSFRLVGTPDVYLSGNRLEVVIVDLGNRGGHPSPVIKRICNLLQKELSSRFGAQRVRVENADR